MLAKIVNATARPLTAATGATSVLIATFGVMSAFNIGLEPKQELAILVFVAVLGNYLIGVTSSAMLRKILGDPEVPTVDQNEPPASQRLPRPPATTAHVDPDARNPWKV